jgi:hypothetical protein
VIETIRKELEANCRIDVTSHLNDMQLQPQGAYIPLEHHLLKLGIVTEVCYILTLSEALHVKCPNYGANKLIINTSECLRSETVEDLGGV